jgi:hypothetical protein
MVSARPETIFFPISAPHSTFYPRHINLMPAVGWFARLDLEPQPAFLAGNTSQGDYIIPQRSISRANVQGKHDLGVERTERSRPEQTPGQAFHVLVGLFCCSTQ